LNKAALCISKLSQNSYFCTSKASKLSTCLRAHRAVRTKGNNAEKPKNTPSLVLLKNKKKEQETKLKKHKTDFKSGLSPAAVQQPVNNRLEELHHLCLHRLQPVRHRRIRLRRQLHPQIAGRPPERLFAVTLG
jgi:hypothetical protein